MRLEIMYQIKLKDFKDINRSDDITTMIEKELCF